MRRPPRAYVVLLGGLALLASFVALVYVGVPPFDNFQVFIFSQVLGVVLVVLFGVLGGAFVGMLLAHRILANREFSPFERIVLERLAQQGERLDSIEKRLGK